MYIYLCVCVCVRACVCVRVCTCVHASVYHISTALSTLYKRYDSIFKTHDNSAFLKIHIFVSMCFRY